jgi:hypothetical protein
VVVADMSKTGNLRRILQPYRKITDRYVEQLYARYYLDNDGFNNYVYRSTKMYPNPEKWRITSYDADYHSHVDNLFDTKEEAMAVLDKVLTDAGFVCLNDEADVEKWLLLV